MVLAALLALPGVATAQPETEPNNDAPTANGPIVGDGVLEGAVSAGDERDYFLVNVAANTQFSVEVGAYDPLDANTGCIRVLLKPLLGDATLLNVSNSTTDEDPTTGAYSIGPVPLRGLLLVRTCSRYGATYKVNLTPPPSLLAAPGLTPASPFNPEPNETRDTAAGPLAPNVTYAGRIDTVNDQDWFKIWVPEGSHQISLQQFEYSGDVSATWFQDANASALGGVNPDDLEWAARDVTVTGPTTLFARVTGTSYPLPYGIRVEPADPLGVTTDINVFTPPDRTAPALTFQRAGKTLKWVRFYYATKEAGQASARLYRRGSLVKQYSARLDKVGDWWMKLTLSATDRRKIRKAHRRGRMVPYTFVLTVTDDAGNQSTPIVFNFSL